MSLPSRNQHWQVVRLHQGAVTVCCTHRHPGIASWCTAWRNRFRPWWQIEDGPRHDIRQEMTR